jgi:acetyl esterase/lipase
MHPLLMTPPTEAFKQGEAALVDASGGAPRVVRGWTLDPRFQFLEAQTRMMQAAAPPAAPTPDDARAQTRMLVALMGGAPEDGVIAEAHTIHIDARAIPARLYTAQTPNPRTALMVFFHFGGGVIGDLDTCHAFCTMLCAAGGGPVLSVDYRLAPEHRFPAGVEDAIAAYRYGVEAAARFGAPAGKAAAGGDSMGGNFAAIIAQHARDHALPAPVAQLLIYPAVDLANESASMTDFADAFPLTRQTMDWFMGQYANPGDDLTGDVRLSPAAGRLEGLAPALIYTAGFDPLVDQGDAYAAALSAAGVKTHHRRYPHLAHAFTAFTGAIPAADAACREIARETAEWLTV